ncbi:hypothetical protein SHJG_8614 [Streptomyces hygroscopicus subsp. jinggangensis 5008]|nr:hypothetical protein SHJG_8614 [Streptomyces hygroscopicus subsp. jinggangensis 5008]AGF68036.1 hypothetical protein SHJGH_8374 [Streptomyces hygroscopicus subsp. jinggangensis TL01]
MAAGGTLSRGSRGSGSGAGSRGVGARRQERALCGGRRAVEGPAESSAPAVRGERGCQRAVSRRTAAMSPRGHHGRGGHRRSRPRAPACPSHSPRTTARPGSTPRIRTRSTCHTQRCWRGGGVNFLRSHRLWGSAAVHAGRRPHQGRAPGEREQTRARGCGGPGARRAAAARCRGDGPGPLVGRERGNVHGRNTGRAHHPLHAQPVGADHSVALRSGPPLGEGQARHRRWQRAGHTGENPGRRQPGHGPGSRGHHARRARLTAGVRGPPSADPRARAVLLHQVPVLRRRGTAGRAGPETARPRPCSFPADAVPGRRGRKGDRPRPRRLGRCLGVGGLELVAPPLRGLPLVHARSHPSADLHRHLAA